MQVLWRKCRALKKIEHNLLFSALGSGTTEIMVLTLACVQELLCAGNNQQELDMAWTTPVVTEVCIGMEVTSYESAEI